MWAIRLLVGWSIPDLVRVSRSQTMIEWQQLKFLSLIYWISIQGCVYIWYTFYIHRFATHTLILRTWLSFVDISDSENGLVGARGTLVVDASIVDFFREHEDFCSADSVFEVLSGHTTLHHYCACWASSTDRRFLQLNRLILKLFGYGDNTVPWTTRRFGAGTRSRIELYTDQIRQSLGEHNSTVMHDSTDAASNWKLFLETGLRRNSRPTEIIL